MPNMDGTNEEMKIITINIPKKLWKLLKALKLWGLIPSVSEALRHSTIKYCQELYELVKEVEKDMDNFDPKKFVRVPGYNGGKPVKIIRRLN